MLTFIKSLFLAAVVVCGCPSMCIAGRLPFSDPMTATTIEEKVDSWRPDGYKFAYQTSFGSSRRESGYLKTASSGRQILVTEGEFSFYGTDKNFYKVNYIADENGYHPSSDSGPQTRINLFSSADYADNSNIFVFPEDDSNSIVPTTTTTESLEQFFTTLSDAAPSPPSVTTKSPANEETTVPDVTPPTVVLNETATVTGSLEDRYGLPPGVIGSLLGR